MDAKAIARDTIAALESGRYIVVIWLMPPIQPSATPRSSSATRLMRSSPTFI